MRSHTHAHIHTHTHTHTQHMQTHLPDPKCKQLCYKHTRLPQPAGKPGGGEGGVAQGLGAHHTREDSRLGVELPREEEKEVTGFVGEVGPL